jgi:hypothetical protein
MRKFVMALALFGAAVLAAGALVADEKKADDKDAKLTKKDLAKLMKDTHRGEKAPYTRVEAELKKDSPDWDVMMKETKAFTEMSAAFKKAELAYTSPAKYIKSAESLTKATADKDKKAATEAFTGLTQSCGSCHYGGAKAMLK